MGYVTNTDSGVAAASLVNSLQLQASLFPFALSAKKTKKKQNQGRSRGKRWHEARRNGICHFSARGSC